MTGVDQFQTATLDERHDATPSQWRLYLAHHVDPQMVGREVVVDSGIELGRKSGLFGEGVLDDGHISRVHARVELNSGSAVIRDCGSHNGTFVNGTRIKEYPLASGDVIGLGRTLLLATYEPVVPIAEQPAGMVGSSQAFLRTVQAVRNAATRGPTVLWGEAGVGKDAFAEFLHTASGRAGPLRQIYCGQFEERTSFPEALESAAGGTIVLQSIEALSPTAQLAFLELFESKPDLCTSIVACTVETPEGLASKLRPELVHRLRRWSIRVPSLAERRSDIPALTSMFARRFVEGEGAVAIDAELAFRLLRHRWPGNLHELEAIVERAAVESNGDTLQLFDGLDALLAQPATSRVISTYGRKLFPDPYVADLQGRWYSTPEGTRHDLERRKTLGRVLTALLLARRDEPGRALSVADLLASAWPEEKLLPRAGANRVYVAVTTLRKMGLRDLLVRSDSGYLLDPEVQLRITDDSAT